MRTLVGRVAGLTLLAAAVTGLPSSPSSASPASPAAPSAPSASQRGTARPVAIALDAAGTSYLGYAGGGLVSVVDSDGVVRKPLALDETRPVSGLAGDGASHLWVAYDDAVSVIDTSDSDLVRHVSLGSAGCANDATHSATRYGGLALGATTVYVADRCSGVIDVINRSTLNVRARVALPGGHQARGLAWAPASRKRPARLFVAVPDLGEVLTYTAGTFGAGSRPAKVTRVTTQGGSHRAVPAGVAIDGRGQLSVTDVANQAVDVYDTTRSGAYHRYRTLGHPSRAADADGYLDDPSALAQYHQDKGGLSGNLFIADTGNGREQRWDVGGGYTFWTRTLAPPTSGSGTGTGTGDGGDSTGDGGTTTDGPTNTVPPAITRNSDGSSLLCDPGTWTGDDAASYAYTWLKDGAPVSSVTGSTYPLGSADADHTFVCRVTVATTTGSGSADSDAYYDGTATVPANTSRPTISGTAAVGGRLLCQTGTWSATPAPSRYAYQWLRNGISVGQRAAYTVVSADVGAHLACTVTATNPAGNGSASSAAVVPSGHATTPPVDPCSAGRGTVAIAGGAPRVSAASTVLTIVAPADATGVQIANDAAFAHPADRALAASCRYAWTLSIPVGATSARVYVRWVGGASAGRVVTDAVAVDRTGPRATMAVVRFHSRHWVLIARGSDPSGIRYLTWAQRPAGGHRVAYDRSGVRVPSPRRAKWVRLTDGLGNVGPWRRTR